VFRARTGATGVDIAPGNPQSMKRASAESQNMALPQFSRLAQLLKAGITCALLAGCASSGGVKPLDTFDLTTPDAVKAGPRRGKIQVLVPEPQALKTLDSENIVVRNGASQIQYLAGAQWSDRLPKIVQARLIQAFEKSGRFGGVGRPGEGLAIDYQIITEIRAFGIEDGVALVEIGAKLLNDRNGVVRSSKTFTASVRAGAGANAFVEALDQAFSSVAADLVAWAGKNI
jgi:cholesterol transport system auxiliary component